MTYPRRFQDLPDYAFPRLRKLLDPHAPGGEVIHMTIGEPRHPMPGFINEVLEANRADYAKYPPIQGTPAWQQAVAGWLERRYGRIEG